MAIVDVNGFYRPTPDSNLNNTMLNVRKIYSFDTLREKAVDWQPQNRNLLYK